MIFGLAGRAGSGKDSVAEVLRSSYGIVPMKFAQPLYEMVAVMVGCTVESLQDRTLKEIPIPAIGKSPRELLQSIGTEWGRTFVGDDVWIKSMASRSLPLRGQGISIVITDVRFDNEADWIRRTGGAVWEVARPRHDTGCVGHAAHHASEAGIDSLLIDRTIVNDGSLGDLADAVHRAVTAPWSGSPRSGRAARKGFRSRSDQGCRSVE